MLFGMDEPIGGARRNDRQSVGSMSKCPPALITCQASRERLNFAIPPLQTLLYLRNPRALRPKIDWPHPTMSAEEIRRHTQPVWDTFYGLKSIWIRSRFIKSLRARLAFVLISKIYRQMYADTGIATDSARVSRSSLWARWLAKPCQRLFAAAPMPHLKVPPIVHRSPFNVVLHD